VSRGRVETGPYGSRFRSGALSVALEAAPFRTGPSTGTKAGMRSSRGSRGRPPLPARPAPPAQIRANQRVRTPRYERFPALSTGPRPMLHPASEVVGRRLLRISRTPPAHRRVVAPSTPRRKPVFCPRGRRKSTPGPRFSAVAAHLRRRPDAATAVWIPFCGRGPHLRGFSHGELSGGVEIAGVGGKHPHPRFRWKGCPSPSPPGSRKATTGPGGTTTRQPAGRSFCVSPRFSAWPRAG
jgi:hypothetical protein